MSDTSVSRQQARSADAPGSDPAWRDWVTIMQSEMAALAVDREAHEAMQRAVDVWAAAAIAAADDPAGCAGPAPPPRTAPALAASDGPTDQPDD